MEISLKKIELVKDRTGVTYAEAKQALEEADGSVVELPPMTFLSRDGDKDFGIPAPQ